MSKTIALTIMVAAFSSISLAEESHYDLLNSLDPAAAPIENPYEDRGPASVEPGQIAVRNKLPEAKLQKTTGTLRWEVLRNTSSATRSEPIEGVEEPHE